MKDAMEVWQATQPEGVRKLAAEFPPGTVYDFSGVTWYVLSYTESDSVILSTIDPYDPEGECHGSICRMGARELRLRLKAGLS